MSLTTQILRRNVMFSNQAKIQAAEIVKEFSKTNRWILR